MAWRLATVIEFSAAFLSPSGKYKENSSNSAAVAYFDILSN
jgi:hypothetical protein